MSTYHEIKELCQILTNIKTVTKRRAAGDKLISLLSDIRIRDRLAREATPSRSSLQSTNAYMEIKHKRHKALSSVWRLVIQSAIIATTDIAQQKKAKLTQKDIILPFQLFKLCCSASSSSTTPQHNNNTSYLGQKEILKLLDYCQSMLQDDQALAESESDLYHLLFMLCSHPKYVCYYRPHVEVHSILADLQEELLGDERPNVAKVFTALLQTLQSLGVGMYLILPSCIEIITEWCRKHSHERTRQSTIYNYMFNALTILMNSHPQHCIPLLLQPTSSSPSTSNNQGHDSEALAGRTILKFAKRCYKHHAQNQSKEALHELLLAYLYVCQSGGLHLEGLLPGDLYGGASTSSSGLIDAAEIEFLIQLVICELPKTMSTLNDSTELRKSASTQQRRRQPQQIRLQQARGPRGRSGVSQWRVLETRQQRHLEVCVRLLACGQRLFLAKAEWESVDDPVDTLFEQLAKEEEQQQDNNYAKGVRQEPCCSLKDLISSPWVQRIVLPLWNFRCNTSNMISTTTSATTAPTPNSSTMNMNIPSTLLTSQQNHDLPSAVSTAASTTQDSNSTQKIPSQPSIPTTVNIADQFPILKEISETNVMKDTISIEDDSSSASILTCLQLICACAEVFPLGECWTSHSQQHWKTYTDDNVESSTVAHSNSCSPHDLALMVFLVSNILEAHGGASGDITIQMWSLMCLIRLTESTNLIVHRFSNHHQEHMTNSDTATQSSIELLGFVWRHVWRLIFKTELRYATYTEAAPSDSAGEMVLILLTEIVKCCCTDPSCILKLQRHQLNNASTTQYQQQQHGDKNFIHTNQNDIWKLPAFSNATKAERGVFELMHAFLYNAGLTDLGDDVIDSQGPPNINKIVAKLEKVNSNDESERSDAQTSSRRCRLLFMTLRRVEEAVSSSSFVEDAGPKILPVASACITALVYGKGVPYETIFESERSRKYRLSGLIDFCAVNHSDVSSFTTNDPPPPSSFVESFFQVVWDDSVSLSPISLHVDMQIGGPSNVFDEIFAGAFKERKLIHKLQRLQPYLCAQSVPASHSSALRSISVEFLESLVKKPESSIPSASLPIDEDLSVDDLEDLDEDNTDEKQGQSTPQESLACRTSALKVFLSTAISNTSTTFVTPGLINAVTELTVSVFNYVPSCFHQTSKKPEEFKMVAANLFQILRALTNLFLPQKDSNVPSAIVRSSKTIFDMCTSMLHEYKRRSRNSDPLYPQTFMETKSRTYQQNQPRFDDDGSDGDDDETPYARETRQKMSHRKAFDDESDDDDFLSPSTAKRKNSSKSSRGNKRSRTFEGTKSFNRQTRDTPVGDFSPPDYDCAKTIAAIILLVQPSYKSCNVVVDAILPYFSKSNSELDSILFDDVEAKQAIECVDLLCNEVVVLHQEYQQAMEDNDDCNRGIENDRATNESVIALICNIIGQIRDGCTPAMPEHMFGFLRCADLVRLGESNLEGDPMKERDCEDIVCLLKSEESMIERRTLIQRPHFRAMQLHAATLAFSHGRFNFHSKFDFSFATEFVMPSLTDLNEKVRHSSNEAVSAALRSLNNERVVDSVLKLFPSLKSKDEALREFRKWYQDKDLGSQGNLTDAENAAWESAFFSLEASALHCRGVIAGSTSDENIFRKVFFDIIEMSKIRPQLQGLCFQVCERTAAMRGYASVEDMIRDESVWLLTTWLGLDYKLCEVPLIMSSPAMFRQLLKAGQGGESTLEIMYKKRRAFSDQCDDSCALDTEQLTADAMVDYAGRKPKVLIPVIITFLASNNEKKTKRGWEYLDEAFDFLEVQTSGSGISKVLRSHLHDLLAFILPTLQHETSKPVGENALKILKDKLTIETFNKQTKKKAHLTILEMLLFPAMHGHLYEGQMLSEHDYVNCIKTFVVEVTGIEDSSQDDSYDFLHGIGSSFTECLVHAKSCLYHAPVTVDKERCWIAIDIVYELMLERIKNGKRTDTQLSFGIHTMVDIMLEDSLRCLRSRAVKKILDIFTLVLKISPDQDFLKELSFVLYRVIGSLLQVHEEAQKDLILKCSSQSSKCNSKRKNSLGLLLFKKKAFERMTEDLWGFNEREQETCQDQEEHNRIAVTSYWDDVPKEVQGLLILSYDALNRVLQLYSHLADSPSHSMQPIITLASQSTKMDFLSSINRKFAGHLLLKKTVGDIDSIQEGALSDLSKMTKTLRDGRFSLHSSSQGARSTGSGNLTIDARLVLGDLKYLWNRLRCRREDLQVCPNEKADVGVIVQEVVALCGPDIPGQIRSAASQCLGELCPSEIADLSNLEFERSPCLSLLGDNFSANRFIVELQAKALELLSKYLMSPRARTSLVAMETAKALLGTEEGRESWQLIKDGESKRLLRPFRNQKKSARRPNSSAIERHLHSLPIDFDLTGTEDTTWCWNTKLWVCPNTEKISFDQWIRHLVFALITCCYSANAGAEKNNSLNAQGGRNFFRLCAEMSALEQGFAAMLFPGIIFDLLRTSEKADKKKKSSVRDNVRVDTFIGDPRSTDHAQLSLCFSKLLASSITHRKSTSRSITASDSRALELIIDTLEMLRIITLKRFLSSKSHKHNMLSLPGRKQSVSVPAQDYNKGIDSSPLWEGVPFGIVLNLDGLDVIRACLYTKRFATALFYVEMYCDNWFGCSVGTLEKLAECGFPDETLAVRNISGFGKINSAPDNANLLDSDDAFHRAFELAELLKACYLELHESEDLRAVENHVSALRFTHEDLNVIGDSSAELSTIEDLRNLDTKWNIRPNQASTSLSIVKCMANLGLRNILKTNLDGLLFDRRGLLHELPLSDQSMLREKWFQESLQAFQWDDSLSMSKHRGTNEPHVPYGASVRQTESIPQGFYETLTQALGSLAQDDIETFSTRLVTARDCVLEGVGALVGAEALAGDLSRFAEQFQVLNDLRDFAMDSNDIKKLYARWGLQNVNDPLQNDSLLNFEGNSKETFFSQRIEEFSFSVREITLRIAASKTSHSESDPITPLISHLCLFCSCARKFGDGDIAQGSLQRLRRLLITEKDKLSNYVGFAEAPLQLHLEEAKIKESQGDFSKAIRSVKLLVNHLQRDKSSEILEDNGKVLLTEALLRCGRWMTDYKVEPAKAILQTYLKPAKEMAEIVHCSRNNSRSASLSSTAHFTLAELAANLYESVSERLLSQEWKQAGEDAKQREKELEKCESLLKDLKKASPKKKQEKEELKKRYNDTYVYTFRLRKEVDLILGERKKVTSSLPMFLSLALQSYGSALTLCDNGASYDVSKHIYRMVSLWFENFARSSINNILVGALEKIPSFRFVPLAYQLFSRIDETKGISPDANSEFQETVQRLVFRMCADHPYHCLVRLIALSNGKKVGSTEDAFHLNVGDSKVIAAEKILTLLRKSDSDFLSELLVSYKTLVESYIDLALAPTDVYHKAKKLSGISYQDLRSRNLCKSRLDLCFSSRKRLQCPPCVLTKPPNLRPRADYGDGTEDPVGSERIERFESVFAITETGIHRPKIVICQGTKGTRFKQLVKGNDDIRQDAVMEQVFTYVNGLMKRRSSSTRGAQESTATSHAVEQLKVVTYNIVPLSPAAGVLEWVNDTISFHEYLNGKPRRPGAHARYYPGEWSGVLCGKHYKASPITAQRETFDVICSHFSPAFRFFFVERFSHSLQMWHTAKMRYTRSCAVNSIVGHMLGIGDRHCQNILIHEKTGEVVHIDFGIVFEQGKTLSVPETVPFRLTRDIVDGMGPTGTEGTFSRAAEATIAVLRENSGSLMTILSAVVSDPMYKWNVSPVKRRQRDEDGDLLQDNNLEQNDKSDSGSANDDATRAISRINEKLQGYEDGTAGERQSVAGQVQLLINCARDHDNLCSIFGGWAPWV